MRKTLKWTILSLAALLALASCKEKPVAVSGLTVNPTTLALGVGKTGTVTATVTPSDAANPAVSWTSSNETVATVSNGTVTALKAGRTVVTATAADGGYKAECVVSVSNIDVTSVTVSPAEAALKRDETLQLTAKVLPEDATFPEVTWSSSNAEVVSVDAKGVVTSHGTGTVTITATSGGKTGSCVITATVPVKGVSLSKSEINIRKAVANSDISPVFDPADATNQNVSWAIGDESIASLSVTDNIPTVTGVKEGETTLTVTTEDGGFTASCKVIVADTPVESVSLSPTSAELLKGETRQFTATVLPELATDKSVAWTTSDEKVATIDADGLLTAVGPGEVTVTVTTNDGKMTATAKVTVKVLATGITASENSLTLYEGYAYKDLVVKVTPDDVSNGAFTAVSSDEAVATVAVADGKVTVTPVKAGEANLTFTSEDGGFKVEVKVVVKATGSQFDEDDYGTYN